MKKKDIDKIKKSVQTSSACGPYGSHAVMLESYQLLFLTR